MAVLKGDVKLVKKLLEHNADVNATDDVGSNPLHRAAENGNSLRLQKKLMIIGLNLKLKSI